MQLINAPDKLVLPFAASGAKNAIPVASQIGIVAGAASLTDGFPPLTRTPLAAGGVPPSGLDMNGIIYELSAILRWANAGAGYVYDGTFAADSNVGGYPKGARVLRSDGQGYWFNTTDNNTTDPEGAGAVAAGWVPEFTNGVAAVTMTGSNVTLTALEYGKPIIVISGLLTANLNLIFPSIAGEWSVINNTTGAFTITCKTAAGTGVVVNSVQAIVGDGTNIYSAPSGITQAAADARYLKLTGGALTGSLTLSGNAVDALQAVPKQQLDAAATPDATTAVKGKVQLATGTEAIAGANSLKVITPATLFAGLNASGSAPVFACRAWVNFKGTGTVTIRASGNVSSITDNGVGDYTVNFTTAMPDTNYATVAGGTTLAANANTCALAAPYAASISSVSIGTGVRTDDAGLADTAVVTAAIFR